MYRLPADLSNNVIKVKIVIACGLNGGLHCQLPYSDLAAAARPPWWDVSE